ADPGPRGQSRLQGDPRAAGRERGALLVPPRSQLRLELRHRDLRSRGGARTDLAAGRGLARASRSSEAKLSPSVARPQHTDASTVAADAAASRRPARVAEEPRRWLRSAGLAALAILVLLTVIDLPTVPYDIDHDLSSSASLEYFAVRGVQFGTQLIQN